MGLDTQLMGLYIWILCHILPKLSHSKKKKKAVNGKKLA